MTHKQIVYGKRSLQAMQLREQGETFAMIGEIFKVSTNDARKLVGRGRTMQRRAKTGMEVVTRELKGAAECKMGCRIVPTFDKDQPWTKAREEAVIDAVIAGSPKDGVTCPVCGDYMPGHATGAGDICDCKGRGGAGPNGETRRRCAGRGDRLKAGLQASAATKFEVPRAFWPRKGAKD